MTNAPQTIAQWQAKIGAWHEKAFPWAKVPHIMEKLQEEQREATLDPSMTDADLATIEQLYANFSGAKSPFDKHRAREYLAAELVRHARELIERAKKAKTANSL